MKGNPGTFYRNGTLYAALSGAPRILDRPASEIADAVARGALRIEVHNGCKIVAMTELMAYAEQQRGTSHEAT